MRVGERMTIKQNNGFLETRPWRFSLKNRRPYITGSPKIYTVTESMIQRHYNRATQQKDPIYGNIREGGKKLLSGLQYTETLIQGSQMMHRLKDLILL